MSDNKLDKSFNAIDVLALAFGSMIGWGWVMLSGQWADDGGMIGAMIAFAIGAVFCIFVGLVYSELTPAIPEVGAGVAFAQKASGRKAALIAGLGTTLAYLGIASWEGPALVSALNYLFGVPQIGKIWTIQGVDVYWSWTFVVFVAACILTWINYKGAKSSAVFQTAATAGIVLVGILLVGGGVVNGSIENAKPFFTSTGGFLKVVLVVPAMFCGFDVIPQAAGEMDVPLKKIPKILILSIIAAAAWYILMIFATCLSAPQAIRAAGAIPVADSMAYAFGSSLFGKICIAGAICGIITSWNGYIFGAARCLYSMANEGLLPAFLGKTHPKYHTPGNATLVCGLICIVTAFLGTGALTWFVDASSFGAVIMYAMVVYAFILLRKNQPDLNRPYKIKNAKFVGVGAVLVVIFFLYTYLPFGPSSLTGVEWGMVLGWFVGGFILSLFSKKKSEN